MSYSPRNPRCQTPASLRLQARNLSTVFKTQHALPSHPSRLGASSILPSPRPPALNKKFKREIPTEEKSNRPPIPVSIFLSAFQPFLPVFNPKSSIKNLPDLCLFHSKSKIQNSKFKIQNFHRPQRDSLNHRSPTNETTNTRIQAIPALAIPPRRIIRPYCRSSFRPWAVIRHCGSTRRLIAVLGQGRLVCGGRWRSNWSLGVLHAVRPDVCDHGKSHSEDLWDDEMGQKPQGPGRRLSGSQ